MNALNTSALIGEHRDALSSALLSLQYVEEGMRMYLRNAYEIIALRVRDEFEYTRSEADVRKKSMGQLLREFRQMTSNAPLVSQIVGLVEDRNFCAHEAFLLTYEEQQNTAALTKAIARIKDIEARAEACRLGLFDEVRRIQDRWGEMIKKIEPSGAV